MGFHQTEIRWIANNQGPKKIGIRGSHITSAEMRQLINAFKTNDSLTIFIFSPRSVDDLTLVGKLFETLNGHESLQELDITTESNLGEDNLSKLEHLVETHLTLHTLNLRSKVCNTEQLIRFTDTLQNCTRLKKFICKVEDIPDDTLFNIIIKLIRYNHLQAILVKSNIVAKEQMENLVDAVTSSNTSNLRRLSLAALAYAPGALQPLLKYLKTKKSTLTSLGLGNITDIRDFKQLADTMSKNTTLTSLYCEITPTNEFFKTAYELISHNDTLTHFEFFTEDHKLGSSTDLESMLNTTRDKINEKLAQNKARKNSLQANSTADNEHSKKRSAYQAVLTPSSSTSHNKRQRPSADEDTSRNTTSPSEGPPSNTTIHVKS